jgi:hypothetical protein
MVVLWRRPARRLGWSASVVALASVVTAVLVISLFTGFLSPLASGMSLSPGYVEPVVGESTVEYDQVRGLGIAVWTTAMLVAAFTVVLVRFRPIPGLVGLSVFLCGAPALAITDPAAIRPLVVGYAMAGLVDRGAAGTARQADPGRCGGGGDRAPPWARCCGRPRSPCSPKMAACGWSQALWSGTVMLAGLVGAAVASLVALPAPTGDAVVDSPLGTAPGLSA